MIDTREGNGFPLAALDWEQLGRSLAMLAPVAVTLRHASVESTLRDYIHPGPRSGMAGRMNAAELASAAMDDILDRLIPGGIAAHIAWHH